MLCLILFLLDEVPSEDEDEYNDNHYQDNHYAISYESYGFRVEWPLTPEPSKVEELESPPIRPSTSTHESENCEDDYNDNNEDTPKVSVL